MGHPLSNYLLLNRACSTVVAHEPRKHEVEGSNFVFFPFLLYRWSVRNQVMIGGAFYHIMLKTVKMDALPLPGSKRIYLNFNAEKLPLTVSEVD